MSTLFPILDAALASAVTRSGSHLACHPGCHQCCIGVFPITPYDAQNLREALAQAPPETAARILTRAEQSRARLTPSFPGDPATGLLFTQPHHEEAFEDFANDEPCPVLDPATGTCDLYADRPVQCRTFGPPIRDDDGNLTLCELCFTNADTDTIAAAELDQSWRTLEDQLIADRLITAAEAGTGPLGPTLIAFALTQP